MTLAEKTERLLQRLRELESAVLAYSGGVDSTLLATAAQKALGDRVVAVIARSPTYPQAELDEALKLTELIGIQCRVLETDELSDPNFAANTPNRCYFCKGELMQKLEEVAHELGFKHVIYGANYDDRGDHRPGMKAAKEHGALAPLEEVGMTKQDIRTLSREWDLPTWDKPSFACLASRFPYGNEITEEKLRIVDAAEQFLREKGFRQYRVRHHGEIARIEVLPEELPKLLQLRQQVLERLTALGFTYITADLAGFRSGSMNLTLANG